MQFVQESSVSVSLNWNVLLHLSWYFVKFLELLRKGLIFSLFQSNNRSALDIFPESWRCYACLHHFVIIKEGLECFLCNSSHISEECLFEVKVKVKVKVKGSSLWRSPFLQRENGFQNDSGNQYEVLFGSCVCLSASQALHRQIKKCRRTKVTVRVCLK